MRVEAAAALKNAGKSKKKIVYRSPNNNKNQNSNKKKSPKACKNKLDSPKLGNKLGGTKFKSSKEEKSKPSAPILSKDIQEALEMEYHHIEEETLLPETRGMDALSDRTDITKTRQSLKGDQTLTEHNYPQSPGVELNYTDGYPLNKI